MPSCGECAVPNYETCACDYDPACCPEFTGCSGCTSETTDQNGCPVCSEDQSITVFGGSCCLDEVTCCPLTDSGCTPSCEPSSSCDECTEGDLVQVAIGDGNNIIGSGGGTVVTDGAVYCCLTSSMAGCGACNPVYHVPGETTASCEGCPVGLYERDNGLWIDCVECTQDSHCDTNNCEACVSNQCQSKCETGQTCNGKGSCCSNGVCCSANQFICQYGENNNSVACCESGDLTVEVPGGTMTYHLTCTKMGCVACDDYMLDWDSLKDTCEACGYTYLETEYYSECVGAPSGP